jgi:hypothetical protein
MTHRPPDEGDRHGLQSHQLQRLLEMKAKTMTLLSNLVRKNDDSQKHISDKLK